MITPYRPAKIVVATGRTNCRLSHTDAQAVRCNLKYICLYCRTVQATTRTATRLEEFRGSFLYEVPVQEVDEQRPGYYDEKRPPGDSGRLPSLLNKDVPGRKGSIVRSFPETAAYGCWMERRRDTRWSPAETQSLECTNSQICNSDRGKSVDVPILLDANSTAWPVPPKEECDGASTRPHVREMDLTGRPIRVWVNRRHRGRQTTVRHCGIG